MPAISVITPLYNTPKEVLARTWASLKAQTFTDWEWVIWDDSTNDNVWNQVYGFCSDERYKIQMHKSVTHSGIIGDVKRKGFMVAKGKILVELDHDDELMPNALEEIYGTMKDGTIDFAFSDWCEILPNGVSGKYPEGWGLGFGKNYWDEKMGVWGLSIPTMNDDSVKHIVGVPNHVRAWNAEFYQKIGGHNFKLDVCDDYELVLRTYQTGSWKHIPKVLYKQHIGNTTQRKKNKRIQELVPVIYNSLIGTRLG